MFVITIFYDDCSDDHAIVVLLVYSLSVVYQTVKQRFGGNFGADGSGNLIAKYC